MKQGLTSHPGARSTNRRPLSIVDSIHQQCNGSLDCHLLFLAELHGAKGHGQVPKDEQGKASYKADIKRLIMEEYRLDEVAFARISTRYSDHDGPQAVRKMLLGIRPEKRSTTPSIFEEAPIVT